MKRFLVLFVAVALVVTSGCKPKPKEITQLQRKEAASLVSEAEFAMSLRDYARAEPLFQKATELCPDDGGYWLGLGINRRRLTNVKGAKEAYEEARSAFRDAYEADRTDSELLLREVYALALLGRVDDATTTLEKARKKAPEDSQLRMFAENKRLERLIAEPSFKEIAL